MSSYFYSAKNNGLYHSSLKDEYDNSVSGWPDDAIPITDDEYNKLIEGVTHGKMVTSNFDGNPIVADEKPLTQEQLVHEAESKRTELIEEATKKIAPLQDAIDIGIATKDEIARLKAWKMYRVMLNRTDTSTAPDIEWTDKPL